MVEGNVTRVTKSLILEQEGKGVIIGDSLNRLGGNQVFKEVETSARGCDQEG